MRSKIIARLASLLVLVSLLGTPGTASAAPSPIYAQVTSATFAPVADAMVRSAYPSMNFGKALLLRVRSSPVVHSYLRFTVSGLNGALVSAAKLRLYTKTSATSSVVVHSVADNSWSETGITYNNAPPVGSAITSSATSFSSGTWLTLNVSSYVKGEGTYSFALTTASAAIIDLASREAGSATAPQLILTLGSWQPSFPIRAAFYYPWFPQAWTQSHVFPYTNYSPQLGFYSSSTLATLETHISMMQYGHIQAGIASWWGRGSTTDANIPYLLQAASGTKFRWALYYELESIGNPSISQIQSDLTYIRNHYGGNPSYLRVNGKFVVFVYTDASDGCAMADRWKKANTVGAYIVLKVFSGYTSCASQPNNWHQYAPAGAADQQGHHSYSISPGFWKYGESVRLARDVTRWTQNVKDMVASGAQWQLITTFSEWGEGTAVEPAAQWSSASGYGQYLDVLHYNGNMP